MALDYKCLKCGSNTFELVVPGLIPEETLYECVNCEDLIFQSKAIEWAVAERIRQLT